MNLLNLLPLDKSHHFISGAIIAICIALSSPCYAEVIPTPKDKIGHLLLGGATYIGCRVLQYEPQTCLFAGMAVGLAKEVYDSAHPKQHSTEMMDFSATATGGLLMFTFEKEF
jgi:hypothetical protein